MPVTFATFQRLKDKGVAAYRKGDYAVAKPYLIQAAECMIELAESAKTPQLRAQHEAFAHELIDLARDCDQAASEKRPRRARAGREMSAMSFMSQVVRADVVVGGGEVTIPAGGLQQGAPPGPSRTSPFSLP